MHGDNVTGFIELKKLLEICNLLLSALHCQPPSDLGDRIKLVHVLYGFTI